MNQIILVQGNMQPVPNDIEVVQDYGLESVVMGDTHSSSEELMQNTFRGHSMLLSGEPEAFVEWLKPFNGVWICTNPLFGDWNVVHIKKELTTN